jgi:hypothetical protein
MAGSANPRKPLSPDRENTALVQRTKAPWPWTFVADVAAIRDFPVPGPRRHSLRDFQLSLEDPSP